MLRECHMIYWQFVNFASFYVCLMVFNATFNNTSLVFCRSVLLVEETGGPRENHRPVASHWQTLSHNVVHIALIRFELTTSVVIGTDCIGNCKVNYHMTTTAPDMLREWNMIYWWIVNFVFFLCVILWRYNDVALTNPQ